MTLLVELKKELCATEQTRRQFEAKVLTLKQREARIRQLTAEFSGSSATTPPSLIRRPMPEEHRRKISEAIKRRHSQNKT
jgi:hypothetical protein